MLTCATFDSVAATYDDEFTRTPIAQLMRRAVWARMDTNFHAGMRVLELGCGTGADAIYLAQRGVHVTATDASANMLAITKQKAERAGVNELIETEQFDMNDVGRLRSSVSRLPSYDGILSNFGALNCLSNLQPLISNLQQWTKPGARVLLVVMGPFCPWEIVWHLLHGQPRQAFRRMAHDGVLANVGGERMHVWYPSPRRLIKLFAPTFKHLRTSGLGVLLPPPYTQKPVASRQYPDTSARQRLATGYWLLNTLERHIAAIWPFNQCGDHYILELERR